MATFEEIKLTNGNTPIGFATLCTDYRIDGIDPLGLSVTMLVLDILFMSEEELLRRKWLCYEDCRKKCICGFKNNLPLLPLTALLGQGTFRIKEFMEPIEANLSGTHVFIVNLDAFPVTSVTIAAFAVNIEVASTEPVNIGVAVTFYNLNTPLIDPTTFLLEIPVGQEIGYDITTDIVQETFIPDEILIPNLMWVTIVPLINNDVVTAFDITKIGFNISATIRINY